jgi:O-antigen ligase
MPYKPPAFDYEPVTRSRRAHGLESGITPTEEWPPHGDPADEQTATETVKPRRTASRVLKKENWIVRRGHALTYLGLFLFTVVLYFRPYELFAALSSMSSMAFWVAALTLAVFIPSQLAVEGTLTARPREVNLVLLLTLVALLSIPLAISPRRGLEEFADTFVKAVLMFILMVNVVRTEWRLKGIIFLALLISCLMSAQAISDYSSGRFAVEGYRIEGYRTRTGAGLFSNPNDMALHLVTMVPIALGFLFSTRNPLKKLAFGACAGLMVTGIVLSFSRGGFLGLVCAASVLLWKIGRRHRLGVVALIFVCVVGFFAVLPGNYTVRIISIFNHSLDPNGSADARQYLLYRSLLVALRHPLLGVGIGNFTIVSPHNLVSHNSYTQVAAEMGIAALALYVMFIVTPLKKLRRIEAETFVKGRSASRFYYLAVGLQASLVGYMVASFFVAVAYQWYIYYLVGYAVAVCRIYEIKEGAVAVVEKAAAREGVAETRANGRRGRALALHEPEAAHRQSR